MSNEEILKGLQEKPYDFIANNYYQLDKEQLKDIILEILAMFEGQEYETLKKDLVESLKDYRGWEE